MTGAPYMRAMQEVTGAALDPQTQARVRAVERSGANVRIFEVTDLRTRPVVLVAYTGAAPSAETLRAAYDRAHLQSINERLQ
jgi:hypothetical protein